MTEAAQWRLEAVRPLLTAYAGTPGVDAVMLGGSTARGDADRWSDVEVGVFWSRPPAAEPQVSTLDGLTIEFVHTLTSEVEQTLDAVLRQHQHDGPSLSLLKGIMDGREAAGVRADLVRRWQARAANYPRGLAVAIVEHDGAIAKFWRLRMAAERGNPLLLARERVRISTQLLTVLHAVNGRYCGHVLDFKRLDAMARQLPIAPYDVAPRLRQVFSDDGSDVLRQLVEETFDLVDIHLPEVDIQRLRGIFRSERKPLEGPPGQG